MDERTTPARLRDATIALVAEGGMKAATARAIAEQAGVSLGLIRHHFGSRDGLLEACDRYLAQVIRQAKTDVISPGMDPLASLRDERQPGLMGYLGHRLLDDGDSVNHLVDLLVSDAQDYLAQAQDAGMMAPSGFARERVALLTIYALGSVVLKHQVKRLLGVDITAQDLTAEPGITAYLVANTEIFAGMFNEATRQYMADAVTALEEEKRSP